MVKDEFANMQNLLRVRFKTHAKLFMWLFIIYALMLLSSLVSTISSILENINTIHYHIVSDNSVLLLYAIVFGFTVGNIMYRSTNAKLSVFPQTNNSRLVSWLLLNYSVAITIALILLIIYFTNYGVIMLMSVFIDGIHLALNVDFGFIIAGFFVYLMYSFLIIAIIEFVGAVIRKWSYYAIVTFIALFTLMIVNIERVIEHIPRVLSFLIAEPSLILFFKKAIGLWLVITIVTLVLNHFTVYHKSQNQALKKRVTIACIIIAVAVTIVTPIILRFSVTIIDNTTNTGMVNIDGDWNSDQFYSESYFNLMEEIRIAEEIRIDVSHLPAGIKININGENIDVIREGVFVIYSSHELKAYVSGVESLENVQGNTLVIRYWHPWFLVNGVEISHFGNPQVIAYLEDDTLFISYIFDKATAMILPVWGMVRQFDIFKDKGVLTGHALGTSAGGSMSISVFIDIE